MNNIYKWYVLQVRSGYEEKVLSIIEKAIVDYDNKDFIKEIFFPEKAYLQGGGNKKHKMMSGYLFIKMNIEDSVQLHKVLSVPAVSKILSGGNKPAVILEKEIDKIKENINNISSGDIKENVVLQVGDEVMVNDGPFKGFVGNVEEINSSKENIKVLMMILGRYTPVILQVHQVNKVV